MREGTASKLSAPIKYEGDSFDEQLVDAMNHFYDIFMRKEVKPQYDGKPIFFNMDKNYGNFSLRYPERFLHIVSMDDDDKYNMYPCTNDIMFESCTNRCSGSSLISDFIALGRWECAYRMSRIHWIREVIDLANKNDPNITEWEELEVEKKDKYKKRLIRYCCGMDDFLIALKVRKKDYYFITAYPVVMKAKKEQCDNQFRKYSKK